MKNLLKLIFATILALVLIIPQTSFAGAISESVQKQIDEQELASQFPIPELKAWETDMDGNKIEVTPLSERTHLRVPNDQFVYVFDHYDPNYTQINYSYKQAGTFLAENDSSSAITVTYKQQNSTTKEWTVGGNISGSASVKAGFLGKIEVEMGFNVINVRSWAKGVEYGVEQVIQPYTAKTLINWQVGVDTNGGLVYKKLDSASYSQVGWYTESAGGTVVSMDHVRIQVVDA